jgi:F0F1-type ATP synthase membrane subunit a
MYILADEMMKHVVSHDLLQLHFRDARTDAPTGARNLFEAIIEFLRVEVFRPALKEHTDRFLPFLWTLFFFILFSNLLGLLPISTIIELATNGKVEHIGGTVTGNINNTAALAILVFIVIHASGLLQVFRDLVSGTHGHHAAHDEHSSNGMVGHEAAMDLDHMRAEALPADIPQKFGALTDPTGHYQDDEHPSHAASHGAAHGQGMSYVQAAIYTVPLYLWNFAPHPFRPQKDEPSWKWAMDIPMWFVLLILEILGAFIKPFALAIRLFANMIAGHMVLAALLTLIVASPAILTQIGVAVPVIILSLLISFLEVLVAFLQAYIFVFLSTLFIASAVAPEH